MANVDYAYPLDSIVNYDGNGVPSFDRAVSSLVLRRLYSYLFTNGVWMATDSTALQVGVAEGMKVSVNAGFTVINGALRLFDKPRTLAIQASENQDRIDTVVARLDLNQDVRNIDLYVLKGASGSSPVRPELTRNDSVYELGLADLFIPAGTTTIPQARITDTRLDTARCGVVSSISEFDTSAFYNQIQADLAHFKSENEAEFEAWVNGQESTFATWSSTQKNAFETWSNGQKSAFETWFDTIKVILDGDVAGHLQNEIDGLNSSIDTSWHASDHLYEGRDLTVVFASEIANYSDEWAWIQARLNTHNLRGIHVADYIPINVTEGGGTPAQVHKAEIAGINTYRRTGDGANEVGYHIDWITRDCYSVPVKWNTENNNNGNSSNAQPFLASNLKNWLDTVVYPRLETKLKNVIKPKIVLAPTRYQSGTTLTDDNLWAWSSFDKLWVPFESEVFDTPAWSTKGYGYGQAVQYPIFSNSYEHRMKGAGPDGGRTDWWLASACSGDTTGAVSVRNSGNSSSYIASYELLVPLCFRTTEG